MSTDLNKLHYGDNLDVLRRYIPDQSVDLIYLDPPFNSRQDYRLSTSDSARISCTAPSFDGGILFRCSEQASYGQNGGKAPFWYHCHAHAGMYRTLGRVYTLPGEGLIFSAKRDAHK